MSVYHFWTQHRGTLTFEITNHKLPAIKFKGQEFVTDDDEIAKQIKDSHSFKRGFIKLKEDTDIKGANPIRTVSGSRGTDTGDEVTQLRKEIEELKKLIVASNAPKVEAAPVPKKRGRPKGSKNETS